MLTVTQKCTDDASIRFGKKEDPVLMKLLRKCAKDKHETQAKAILKKIETESKLSAKEEKWIQDFQGKQQNLYDDPEGYQIDIGDMVPADHRASESFEDTTARFNQRNREAFFTVETVEDIHAESSKKSDLLAEDMQILLRKKPANMSILIADLSTKMQEEEKIRKKNTSVHVYSLSFQTIRESKELQDLVVQCERILLRHFFHAHFLHGQLQSIICALTKACDCVVSMRTGGGKTMIFAIPALLEDHKTTIVFSPLRSLIIDQMNEMKKLGIESGYLMSEIEMKKMGGFTRNAVLQRLIRGELKVLFTTPEQAFSSTCKPYLAEMIAQKRISRIVVDEAHLLRQWQSFRSQFESFGNLREVFPAVPMLLMTACLPRETRSHLSSQIGFAHVMINRCESNRRNAFYMVQRKICDCFENASLKKDEFRKIRGPTLDRLVDLLKGPFCGASAIIYCRTAKLTGILSNYLRLNICDFVSRHFNAQLSQEERVENQKFWTESKVPVMVATCAFGLGINHPHVRLIVHWDMPQTLDDYFQQAGRAGRDGAPCLILSFYHQNDLDGTLNLGVSNPRGTIEVASFMENQIFCRRALILSEYAEPTPPSICKTSCDVCYYQKTWGLYDISRFANSLLALVLYLPLHIEALDVKRDPFKWLVNLLRGDIQAIKSLLTNGKSSSLCKTGIIPGYGSMKNLCKDDAFTILLSLFEHGVFKVTKQESKQFARSQQSHTWKIEPGDDIFPIDVSSCKSERLQRLVKPRFIHPMLIPLPTVTIQRLQKPVGGTWDDSPDHAMFCGWCKLRCFTNSLDFDQVRIYPCAPILAHSECINDEHDDEENRKKYDDPDTCMLCRNIAIEKKSKAVEEISELIVCSECNKGTCYQCLHTLYELDDDAIRTLTSMESAKWYCANCDPFTVPLCYQWHRAERILESGKSKDVVFRKQNEPLDLLSALLQQSHMQCEQAMQFCHTKLTYMEHDLLPLEVFCHDEFPLCSFVTLNESGDSAQCYYMVMAHSNAGRCVYAVEFIVNSRSNALQPPKPQLCDLFDEKLLLRLDRHKIKRVIVNTVQTHDLDGISNVWCPSSTINKIRRELLAKIKAKQKYKWTPLDILAPPKSEVESKGLAESVVHQHPCSPTPPGRLLKNVVDSIDKRKKSDDEQNSQKDKLVSTNRQSHSLKRRARIEEDSSPKIQKTVELLPVASSISSSRSKLEEALYRMSTGTDAKYFFGKKDPKLSFDVLMVSLLSHSHSVLPIRLNAVRLSQGSLAMNEYGEFSIYHAVFLVLHQADLPMRSSDICLILQSMGFVMLDTDIPKKSPSAIHHFEKIIENTLTNHHRDFPGGIFQCKKQYWFLNPNTKLLDICHSKNRRSAKLLKLESYDSIPTEPTHFGRCLNIHPNTFLRVESKANEYWYCMVTVEKGTGNWQRPAQDDEGNPIEGIQILVRWFQEPKKGGKPLFGAREIYAFGGGTDLAWDWIHTDSIKEVICIKWGLPEPHELHWFEYYYTKNLNEFEVLSSGKKEECISECHPVQYQEDFWDENLLEFHNPDPYESKLYSPHHCVEIFDSSVLASISIECEKSVVRGNDTVSDRTYANVVCARNLMSRQYAHSRSTKMNIRTCYMHEYANLFEAIIFTLLQNQVPMLFRALCKKIGVVSEFCDDLKQFCKNVLPEIFWVDSFADDKDDYISLKIWETAFEVYRKSEQCTNSKQKDKAGREGVSWKRAYEAVATLYPRASYLYICALIADSYPALFDRHKQSSAIAANCLHEIDKIIDSGSVSSQHDPVNPEALKLMRWGAVSRSIMQKSASPNLVSRRSFKNAAFSVSKLESLAPPAEFDHILITSDDDQPSEVIDLDTDSDDDEFCEILLHRKRPFEQSQTEPAPSGDKACQKLGTDDQTIFKFALLLCLKGLQSNFLFQLSKIRDTILHLCPQGKNVMAIVELAAFTLHERDILIYNSASADKECDPSPCFQRNMDEGLIVSVSDSASTHFQFKQAVNAEEKLALLIKSNSRKSESKIIRLRSEFSFVAPPECESFQDQKVFLRSSADLNEVSTTSVTRYTSMYSHFTDLESAISHLTTLEENEKNHACRDDFHPIVQLVEGRFKFLEPQDKVDDDDLDFEEPKFIRHEDDVNPEAFKPFCQRPDPNLPDYGKKFEKFLQLDFEVAYSIEHFISSGGMSWNSLDHQDFEKLERYSCELANARKLPAREAYTQILNKIKVQLGNKVNLEKMKNQLALDNVFEELVLPANKKDNERKKIASEDIQAMERCSVFSGVFHDRRGVKLKPSVYGKFSCRAYRKFGSDRFITVSIPRSTSPHSVQCLLNHGFKTIVGERWYRFVPSGDSHLKERKLMFFAVSGHQLDTFLPQSFLHWHIPLSRDPNSDYFSNSEIISIKFFARFQLCFSSSAVAMTLSPEEYEYVDDIELDVPGSSKKVCATDGCGRAPPIFFAKIKELFKLPNVPSCIQMRFGGCKGLLHVDTSAPKVQFRLKSQRKYVCDAAANEQRQIEVTSWSPSYNAAASEMSSKLNLQLAFVLRSMGVPDHFFYSLLLDIKALVMGAIGKGPPDKIHRDAALDFVKKYKGMPQCEQIKDILEQGILQVDHPYVVRGLKHAIDLLLNPIQSSFHMPVPDMKFLYGVPDPTGILEYGQCFVLLGDPAGGALHRRFEDTEVVVGRNPMQHPGDVRKLTAVWVPKLYDMKLVNVLVFPVKANPKTGQLLNDEMSGGDFDGDQYIFIWNTEIVKHAQNHDPYPYYLDGKPLTTQMSSAACSDSHDAPAELIESPRTGAFDLNSSKDTSGSEILKQHVFDILPSNSSNCSLVQGSASTFDEQSTTFPPSEFPPSSLNGHIEPNEGSNLQQFSVVLSDPSRWTSDDVKGHFSSKIGTSSEEAYEKLKLCALGVICHWDNSLGRLCNLQRDIADFSLHDARTSQTPDIHRTTGFADPRCIEIAPLVARAVDSLKTGEIVRVPKKGSKTAEHWLKSSKKSKPGSTYDSGSLFGVICKMIWELQHSVTQFVQNNSSMVVNSQLIDSMCQTQHRSEVNQLVQKVRKRVDEEFLVLFENASQFDPAARSQHITEGISRICKENEEFVRQNLADKGYGANLQIYIKMFVGLLYQSCYADMHRISDNAHEQRKKTKDTIDSSEDPDAQAAEHRASRDASAKWTLVQLPFKMFGPVLQT